MENIAEQSQAAQGKGEALPLVKRAAKASWQTWLLLVLSLMLANRLGLGLVVELLSPLLLLFGVGAGLFALSGMRRHGVSGILAPALAGIVLNGLLLAIFVTNFLAAYRR